VGDSAGNNANYSVTYADNKTSTINQEALSLTTSNVTKTYDGGLSAVGSAIVKTGTLYSGDSLSGGSFAFTDKNFGLGNKTVTTTGVTVGDSAGNNANYSVTYADNTTSTINKAALALNAVIDSKTYDGDVISNKAVSVVNSSGSNDRVVAVQEYTDKNVLGIGLSTLQVKSGYTIFDSNNVDMSGNYNVVTHTVNGSILPKHLSVLGSIANNKFFDGNVSVKILPGVLTGLVGQETLDLSVSGAFVDSAIGNNKPVMARYSLRNGLHGGLVSNYVLDDEILHASIGGFPQIINPVPVNPSYKTPETVQIVNEKVAVTGNTQVVTEKVMVSDQNQQSAKKDQQACSKDFSADCNAQQSLGGGLQFTHKYDTFY
jgi:hypothetical protein